ncbi:sugar kinase [Catenovulum maritimum]|uniref:Carbohydrate kinase n=1 Tax=Catenovulum maritimum TaxID=1513271 RepID=A0A0J8JHC6_9ALTE|nr:sugar kinase [Catenovulum maritimum]KMT63826.1 carbohydrate kinase [Catenovulum maritimum]
MGSLLALGEGMVELKLDETGQLIQKFAGDTLNAAIYAKRWAPSLDVYFYSALGKDMFSEQMHHYLESESLKTDCILTSPDANIGIYAIQTDDTGERSFTYWRKESAATQMIQLLQDDGGSKRLVQADCVFFSGISLAILSESDKEQLLTVLAELKEQGCKIAFDPNYRARMWRDEAHAKEWMSKAYLLADIVLPGLDEHEDLFGHTSIQDVVDFMQQHEVAEYVIKAGKDGVYAYNQETNCHIEFNPAPTQVDSTAAGDSFAGTYLASRVSGETLLVSIQNADKVAREVVQHRGAIVDSKIFNAKFK